MARRDDRRAPRHGGAASPPEPVAGPAAERRRRLGQNFFRSTADAAAFARQTTAAAGALVVDVGAGSGQVTRALVGAGHPVLALEIDPYWAERLAAAALPGVRVVTVDALRWRPDDVPAVLVGNLPFGTGTKIVRHVLGLGPDAVAGGTFLLQSEYVGKRVGRWGGNLFNAQWAPWFTFAEGLAFPRTAFRPVPRADAATLVVRPRAGPVVPWPRREEFQQLLATVYESGQVAVGDAARAAFGRDGRRALDRAGVAGGRAVTTLQPHEWAAVLVAAAPAGPGPRGRRPGRR